MEELNKDTVQKINHFWDFLNHEQKQKAVELFNKGDNLGAMLADGYNLTINEFNEAFKILINERSKNS